MHFKSLYRNVHPFNEKTKKQKHAKYQNQCWAVLRMRDKYPLAINLGIHPLTHPFSKKSKNQF
jgi:hypothetical protein